jgi:hypothetical protein
VAEAQPEFTLVGLGAVLAIPYSAALGGAGDVLVMGERWRGPVIPT